MPLLDPYGMSAGRGLFRATPIVTCNHGFRSLTRKTSLEHYQAVPRTYSNRGPQGRQINVKKNIYHGNCSGLIMPFGTFLQVENEFIFVLFHNNKK